MNPKNTIGSRITVIVFSSIVLLGAFGLKVYSHLGDVGFVSVSTVLCLVVLVTVFIGPIESFTLGVTGLKAKIAKVEHTESAIKQVAKALLNVIETSQDQMFVCEGHDKEAAAEAMKRLKALIV